MKALLLLGVGFALGFYVCALGVKAREMREAA